MKKSLLAIAVASVAAFASTAVTAATVYDKDGTTLNIGGRIEAMYGSGYTGTATNGNDGAIRDRIRLNITGKSKINDWATGYGHFEIQNQHVGSTGSGDTTDEKLRLAYAGLDFGKFGRIQAGRDGVLHGYAVALCDTYGSEDGRRAPLVDRVSGQISYQWDGYGFHAGVAYQAATDNEKDLGGVKAMDIDSGFGIVLGYTSPEVLFGPIQVRAGYTYYSLQDEAGYTVNYDDFYAVSGGLAWGNAGKGFYIGADYSYAEYGAVNAKNGDFEATYVNAMAKYTFDSGVAIAAGYAYVKEEEDKGSDGDSGDIIACVSWKVNSNFYVWAEGHFDAGSDDGFGRYKGNISTNNETTATEDGHNAYFIGARYTF